MANDINRLIDMIYERIEDAKAPALKPNMSMVDRDEVLDLLEGASRGLISRGGLPAHSFRDMVEVNVIGGEEALHVVLSMEDGLFAVYQDPDWSYAIREGEALAAAVEALLPA